MCHSQGQMIDILCSTQIKYCKESSASEGIKPQNIQSVMYVSQAGGIKNNCFALI